MVAEHCGLVFVAAGFVDDGCDDGSGCKDYQAERHREVGECGGNRNHSDEMPPWRLWRSADTPVRIAACGENRTIRLPDH